MSDLDAMFSGNPPQPVEQTRTPSQIVIDRILELVPTPPVCPFCRTLNGFNVSGAVVNLLLSDFYAVPSFFGQQGIQPCASLTCNHCGYTLLINLFIAGLGELTGLDPPQPPSREASH